MLTASIVCPHCHKADLATFADLVEYGPRETIGEADAKKAMDYEIKISRPSHHQDISPKNRRNRPVADDLLPVASILICQKCFLPMMATVQMTRIELINHQKQLHKLGSGVANTRFDMDELTIYPEPPEPVAHKSWPEKAQRLMIDIDRMVQQGMDPSIIIATCRTVIDLCTKDLGGEGTNIFSRINALLAKGIITKPIADWAHKIRSLGADATHDAEGTDDEAAEFASFLKFFLKASYELSFDMKKAVSIFD